jgi:hypothetical protein
MGEREISDVNHERAASQQEAVLRAHAAGAPLSTGVSRRAPLPQAETSPRRFSPPPPARAVENPPARPAAPSKMQRTMNILRSTLPFVQRLLPLLDGNVGTALSNLAAPQTKPEPPAKKLDLTPLEDSLTELRSQQHSLRLQVIEQNMSLKRVEDHLEMVREATDRNTLEQQELLDDMKAFGKKIKMAVILALILAACSFLVTLAILLHAYKILP